jgi:hypothetical protein
MRQTEGIMANAERTVRNNIRKMLQEAGPTEADREAAKIICTAYRDLLTAAGMIDDLNVLPKEIEGCARIIAKVRRKHARR